jgi:40-residue YVTN family beta-propeller repeat
VRKIYTSTLGFLGIATLAFLMLVSITGATPFAYITNSASNNVSVIDTATNIITATVNVGNTPIGAAVAPDGTKVYVTNWLDDTVSVINTATNTVTATVPVGDHPVGVAITPNGKYVYLANGYSNDASVINTTTNTVVATVHIPGSYPSGVAANPNGKYMYITTPGSNNIHAINTSTNTIAATVTVGSTPVGVAVSPDGKCVYVTNAGSNTASVINASTNIVATNVNVGSGPEGVAVTPDGKYAYVTNGYSNNVYVINTSTYTVTATVPVGSYPIGVAVTPDGKKVYVSNMISNTVSIIDSATNTVTDTVNVGGNPYSDGQFIVPPVKPISPVANFSSNVSEGYAPLFVQFNDSSENADELAWDFNGDGISDSEDRNPINIFTVPGTYTISLTASNANGIDSETATINVLTPPPSINSIAVPLDPVLVNTKITASASVTYLGDLNDLTAEWNWGDGSVSQLQGTSNFESSHVYSSTGIYTVTLTVNDTNRGIDTQQASDYVIVYNPEGGFVAGGGWINSPAGAFLADENLEGKATFGFVSKYQKGAKVPTGNTEFQFKVAELNFKSTSYDWLVVAGPQAKYKGTGTINGEGNYGFMLSAVDGAIKGDSIDRFRIKIWDKENENTIYDNEIGTAEDTEPVTSIGGGSIIIHTGK